MAFEEHPNFATPDDDAVIWRYIDLAKFMSLLSTQGLFFSRSDQLGDPLEGSLAEANVARRVEVLGPDVALQQQSFKRAAWEEIAPWTLINCWYGVPYESDAMWRLYAGAQGVALKSTVGRLKASLSGEADPIHIGRVEYVDFETAVIPEDNLFSPYLVKRQHFEHEREVRAIKFAHGQLRIDSPPPGGELIAVDLANLIEEVRVSPAAPPWMRETVANVVSTYGLKAAVIQSSQLGSRIY